MIKYICKNCGKIFFKYPAVPNVKYCSVACRAKMQVGKKRPEVGKKQRGENHPMWIGGVVKNSHGNIMIYSPHHPYCTKTKYVKESRLVSEKCLGRFLEPTEIVHHIDLNPLNNHPKNLFVFENISSHVQFHLAIRYGKLDPHWLKTNL